MRGRFFFLLLAAVLCAIGPLAIPAQTADLRVTKSGSDVVLTIVSGGTSPYDYYKALSPTISVGATVLSSANPSTSFTETGGMTDGKILIFYQIGDANKPAIAISAPAPGSSVSTAKVLVTGTQTNAVKVWVNDIAASIGAGTFTSSATSTPNVPLVEGTNSVTASAVDASGNTAVTKETLTKLGNNADAPAITIAINPSVGTDPYVVYTPAPAMTVNYSDADGDGIDTSKVFVYLNGDPLTPTVIDGAHATYTLPALQPGTNFISVSVADNAGAAFRVATKTAILAVRGPLISTLAPTSGKVGDTITVTGHGFSTSATDDVVTFTDGVTAIANASPAPTESSFQVAIPTGAQTGSVKVTVASSDSNNDQQLTIIMASGISNVGGLCVDRQSVLGANDLPVLFTDRGTTDNVSQCKTDGTWTNFGAPVTDPTGLAVDAGGNAFTGQSNSGSGFTGRFTPGSGIFGYTGSTKLSGETYSSIWGTGVTGQWQSSGSTLNLYLLDGANSKIKQVDPALTVTAINTNPGTFSNPNAAAVDSTGSTLYFGTTATIRKISLASPTTASDVKTFVSVKAIAITDDDKLIYPNTANTKRQISVVDPNNPSGCAGSCLSYDLTPAVSSGNYPLLVAYSKGLTPGYIVVADGSTNTTATRVYRLLKPSLTITQAGGSAFPEGTKIYADWNGSTGTESPDSQFAVLRVVTSPTTLFPNGAAGTYPAVVEWHFEDPRDPTDPSGHADDNCQTCWDGWNALAWEQEGSYTSANIGGGNCSTAVINGESRVRFHYTGYPGDNYIIKVRAKIPGFGTPSASSTWDNNDPGNGYIQATTPILTVWKRLHVAVDSFGAVQGPLDADDAAFDDLPDPIANAEGTTGDAALAPLKEILAPAFVEPFYDATNSKGDIAFNYQEDYAIPVVNGTSADDTVLIAERNEHAGSVSNTGSWGVYLLGAYEVADGKYFNGTDYSGYSDNDPDGETIPGTSSTGWPTGMTASNCGSGAPSISVTFDEEIRDLCAQNGYNYWHDLNSTAWHEAGHQLHLSHAATSDGSGGLMEPVGPQKNLCLPRSYLDIIRALLYPSCLN